MSNNKYEKLKIITKYTNVMKEYFELMSHSEVIKSLANPNNNLLIGMNVIHRVFEYILIKTKNIENAYFYSQKGSYYYLEYLEQINKSEFANVFSHMDAIMLVYKKTIFDIYDGETNTNGINSTISNLLSLNNEQINISQKDLRSLFNIMFKFTHTIFFWNNVDIKFQYRIDLCNNYLFRYLNNIDCLEFINSYIELIQEKMTLSYDKYNSLLSEIIIRIEKMKKKSLLKNFDESDFFFNKLYMERHIFHENINNECPKELVKQLFE
jgi:hypothetical protein